MSNRCAYCDKGFDKKTHNQKYCDSECCRKATNERILKRYYEKRDNRSGKERVCKNKSCGRKLSRYNDESFCSACSSLRKPSSSKVSKVIRGL